MKSQSIERIDHPVLLKALCCLMVPDVKIGTTTATISTTITKFDISSPIVKVPKGGFSIIAETTRSEQGRISTHVFRSLLANFKTLLFVAHQNPSEHLTEQMQKFGVRFLFLIFADENFADGNRNAKVEI